jgi:hypothetical protein
MRIRPSKSTVRWLVLLEILLVIACALLEDAEATPASPSPDWLYWPGVENVRVSQLELFLSILLLILGVAASIGVWKFKPWGRKEYLIYHALALTALLIPGPERTPFWAAVVYGSSFLVAGFVLYLLYFTPLKECFEKRKTAVQAAKATAAASSMPGCEKKALRVFFDKWLNVSKYGFWKSALAVYVIFSFSCWAAYRFDLDNAFIFALPVLGLLRVLQAPFFFLIPIVLAPANFLTNLGILEQPNKLHTPLWIIVFWLAFLFLLGLTLFGSGKKKWISLGLLLLFMMLATYDCHRYVPVSM